MSDPVAPPRSSAAAATSGEGDDAGAADDAEADVPSSADAVKDEAAAAGGDDSDVEIIELDDKDEAAAPLSPPSVATGRPLSHRTRRPPARIDPCTGKDAVQTVVSGAAVLAPRDPQALVWHRKRQIQRSKRPIAEVRSLTAALEAAAAGAATTQQLVAAVSHTDPFNATFSSAAAAQTQSTSAWRNLLAAAVPSPAPPSVSPQEDLSPAMQQSPMPQQPPLVQWSPPAAAATPGLPALAPTAMIPMGSPPPLEAASPPSQSPMQLSPSMQPPPSAAAPQQSPAAAHLPSPELSPPQDAMSPAGMPSPAPLQPPSGTEDAQPQRPPVWMVQIWPSAIGEAVEEKDSDSPPEVEVADEEGKHVCGGVVSVAEAAPDEPQDTVEGAPILMVSCSGCDTGGRMPMALGIRDRVIQGFGARAYHSGPRGEQGFPSLLFRRPVLVMCFVALCFLFLFTSVEAVGPLIPDGVAPLLVDSSVPAAAGGAPGGNPPQAPPSSVPSSSSSSAGPSPSGSSSSSSSSAAAGAVPGMFSGEQVAQLMSAFQLLVHGQLVGGQAARGAQSGPGPGGSSSSSNLSGNDSHVAFLADSALTEAQRLQANATIARRVKEMGAMAMLPFRTPYGNEGLPFPASHSSAAAAASPAAPIGAGEFSAFRPVAAWCCTIPAAPAPAITSFLFPFRPQDCTQSAALSKLRLDLASGSYVDIAEHFALPAAQPDLRPLPPLEMSTSGARDWNVQFARYATAVAHVFPDQQLPLLEYQRFCSEAALRCGWEPVRFCDQTHRLRVANTGEPINGTSVLQVSFGMLATAALQHSLASAHSPAAAAAPARKRPTQREYPAARSGTSSSSSSSLSQRDSDGQRGHRSPPPRKAQRSGDRAAGQTAGRSERRQAQLQSSPCHYFNSASRGCKFSEVSCLTGPHVCAVCGERHPRYQCAKLAGKSSASSAFSSTGGHALKKEGDV